MLLLTVYWKADLALFGRPELEKGKNKEQIWPGAVRLKIIIVRAIIQSWNFADFDLHISAENLPGRGFGALWSHVLCFCVICMGNCSWFTDGKLWFTDDDLVISGEVYVAWKRRMLDDVIGGYQAYIQRKKDLFRGGWQRGLEPSSKSKIKKRFSRTFLMEFLDIRRRAVWTVHGWLHLAWFGISASSLGNL